MDYKNIYKINYFNNVKFNGGFYFYNKLLDTRLINTQINKTSTHNKDDKDLVNISKKQNDNSKLVNISKPQNDNNNSYISKVKDKTDNLNLQNKQYKVSEKIVKISQSENQPETINTSYKKIPEEEKNKEINESKLN